ncbi:alkaline phosphatase D family protein [Dongia mobilis]|uniref:alkaline phosphatase D family protein n=1 Tax=Dongia sp. TaxID=1977262 RepID=UPI0026EBE115
MLSRRRLLIAAGTITAGFTLSSSGFANFAPYYAHRANRNPLAASSDPFTLGVASGSPRDDGFVLWTRLAPDPLSTDPQVPGGIARHDHGAGILIDYEIATDPQMRRIVRQGSTLAEADFAYAVHLDIGGLAPARPYWYRFRLGDHETAIGRANTLPQAGRPADSLRLGFTSCANYERGYFSAYRHLADEQPDLVLMLGDYIYEQVEVNRPVLRRHSDHAVPATLDGYRRRYAQYRQDSDLQRLHATAPTLVTWDDHEVENDYAGAWSETLIDPDIFLQRRQAAYQAFYEHMPVRTRPGTMGLRIHDSVMIGDLARISLLDGRQYRSRGACYGAPDRGGGHLVDSITCPELIDPARSMLGFAQEKWLQGKLATSPARWNLLAQNVIMAQLGTEQADGTLTAWTDAWDGYPAARTRLLQQLAGTRNPVVFGGDIHSFWNNDLKLDFRADRAPVIATEFITSSITSDGPPQDNLDGKRADHGHIHFAESRQRGYASVTIEAGRLTTDFRAVSDVTNRAATISTLKSFVIEDGVPGALAA